MELDKVPLIPIFKGKDINLIELSKKFEKIPIVITNIQYIIVPNSAKRRDLISFLKENFKEEDNIILISKIMILDQIKKDF